MLTEEEKRECHRSTIAAGANAGAKPTPNGRRASRPESQRLSRSAAAPLKSARPVGRMATLSPSFGAGAASAGNVRGFPMPTDRAGRQPALSEGERHEDDQ
jgi:hypothetical protein